MQMPGISRSGKALDEGCAAIGLSHEAYRRRPDELPRAPMPRRVSEGCCSGRSRGLMSGMLLTFTRVLRRCVRAGRFRWRVGGLAGPLNLNSKNLSLHRRKYKAACTQLPLFSFPRLALLQSPLSTFARFGRDTPPLQTV